MRYKTRHLYRQEEGFSLVELMVGLVIGLFATLVVMQTFSVFEGQKRSTSGTADAQTNGTIALMQLQRHLKTAGYGMPMPMADFSSNILNCVSPAATNMFPVAIVDGANGNAGDTIVSRYSTSAAGGGVPVEIISGSNATVGDGMTVDSNMGCNSDLEMDQTTYNDTFQDINDTAAEAQSQAENNVMILYGNQCATAKIAKQPNNVGRVSYIRLEVDPAGLPADWTSPGNSKLSCTGNYGTKAIAVNPATNELVIGSNPAVLGDPVVSEVVAMQAQYGVSATADSNVVASWEDAVGIWQTPTVANRNRIKAIRVALVLRNGLKEKTNVTTTAPQAWLDSGSTSVDLDVSFLPDWQRYRYRVYGTTVPLRNMIWSREAM